MEDEGRFFIEREIRREENLTDGPSEVRVITKGLDGDTRTRMSISHWPSVCLCKSNAARTRA